MITSKFKVVDVFTGYIYWIANSSLPFPSEYRSSVSTVVVNTGGTIRFSIPEDDSFLFDPRLHRRNAVFRIEASSTSRSHVCKSQTYHNTFRLASPTRWNITTPSFTTFTISHLIPISLEVVGVRSFFYQWELHHVPLHGSVDIRRANHRVPVHRRGRHLWHDRPGHHHALLL